MRPHHCCVPESWTVPACPGQLCIPQVLRHPAKVAPLPHLSGHWNKHWDTCWVTYTTVLLLLPSSAPAGSRPSSAPSPAPELLPEHLRLPGTRGKAGKQKCPQPIIPSSPMSILAGALYLQNRHLAISSLFSSRSTQIFRSHVIWSWLFSFRRSLL